MLALLCHFRLKICEVNNLGLPFKSTLNKLPFISNIFNIFTICSHLQMEEKVVQAMCS